MLTVRSQVNVSKSYEVTDFYLSGVSTHINVVLIILTVDCFVKCD